VGDFTLVDAPRAGPSYLVADSKGEFYGIKSPQEAPFQPVGLPDVQNTNVMVQVTVASYVPDTAAFALWKDGLLVAHIDDSMIPPNDLDLHFNTDSFRYIIPALYAAYPSKPLQATIQPSDTPRTVFEANGMMGLNAKLDMLMYVVNSTTDIRPVFTLGVNVVVKGFVKLSNNAVFVNATYGNITLTLKSTQIGNFDIQPLNDICLLIISEGLPAINQFTKNGIPLPKVDHVDFVNPYLGYGDGFIYLNTDIVYTPSTPRS